MGITSVMAAIGWWEAVFIGIIEGITEFLPISSTAHMAILPQLMGMGDPGTAFSAIVQLGPVVAIIAYFWGDLRRYAAGILRRPNPLRIPAEDTDARLGWWTLLATIPGGIAGVLLEKWIDHEFRSLYVIAAALILLAVFLWIAEAIGKRAQPLETMSLKQSQIIGWAQVLSLVPGASRSGVTMTAGLFLGLDRESATRFSFLLSVPILTAAGLYKMAKALRGAEIGAQAGPYLAGTLIAGITAYIVIQWFLGYVRRHDTRLFIVYRILLGIALIALLQAGVIRDSSEATPSEGARKSAPQARSLFRPRGRLASQGGGANHCSAVPCSGHPDPVFITGVSAVTPKAQGIFRPRGRLTAGHPDECFIHPVARFS